MLLRVTEVMEMPPGRAARGVLRSLSELCDGGVC